MRYVAHALSLLLSLGAVMGFTSSAGAGDVHPKATPSNGSSMVKDLVRRGRRARDKGRWTEAHAAYKAAFEAADPASGTELERAEIAGELGLCELALRMYRDAAEHLAWSLEQREALPPAQQQRFGEGLRKARPFVATLILAVDPPDAEVFVDGKAIGRTARTYKLFFEPGQHMVRARAPGRGESLHGLRAVAAAEHEISMKLPQAAVSSAKDAAPAAPELASASPPARADDDWGRAGVGAGNAPCQDGEPGKKGLDADRASGAVGAGYLTEDGWIGVPGEDGKRGGIGQGGGGGSKSRGDMVACRVGQPQAGAAGGSGGSGGCGGRGGKGGGYGGSSIGVVALQGSAVTLEATAVTTGNAGNGGLGGDAGAS
ncbi:hypothetical protein ACMHYB_38375 [Sorangium sp. So ce1128]